MQSEVGLSYVLSLEYPGLPLMREALVRWEIAHYTLHRTAYRKAPLSVREIGSCGTILLLAEALSAILEWL